MKKGEKTKEGRKEGGPKERKSSCTEEEWERERPWKRGEFGEEAEGVHVLWQETCWVCVCKLRRKLSHQEW